MIIVPEQPDISTVPYVGEQFNNDIKIFCVNIGIYQTPTHPITFYSYKNNTMILGVDDKNKVIFNLILQPFNNASVIKKTFDLNALQVWRTYIDVDYRRFGITTQAYGAYVTSGKNCLVCGTYQTVPTMGVWKKMAVDSATSKFELNVIEKGVILMGDNVATKYDGTNIEDPTLWSILPDRDKEETLLILRAKSV